MAIFVKPNPTKESLTGVKVFTYGWKKDISL
jgi:hypothetical protein